MLDVREDILAGREPFSKIMAAAAALKAGEDLLLIAPFEPRPLFEILAAQGLEHEAREMAGGDWEVRFQRAGQGRAGENPTKPPCRAVVVDLDVRDLEPPQPMVKILEAAAVLPAGAELHARTVRRPLHLLPQLQARGFQAESIEQPDGGFLTVIRHA